MIGARSRYLAFSVCRHQSEKSWGSRRCFGVCGKHVVGTRNAAKPCRNSFYGMRHRALKSKPDLENAAAIRITPASTEYCVKLLLIMSRHLADKTQDSRVSSADHAPGASHVGPAHRRKVSYAENWNDCDSKWRVDLRLCYIQHFRARSFDTSAVPRRNYRIFQDDGQANRNGSFMPKSVE
jgi:hypothetical protein